MPRAAHVTRGAHSQLPRRARSRSTGPQHQRIWTTRSGHLSHEIRSVEDELQEVRTALCEGGSFLGLSGTLLQEYFVEITKKHNLLASALAKSGSTPLSGARQRRRSTPALRIARDKTSQSTKGKVQEKEPESVKEDPECPHFQDCSPTTTDEPASEPAPEAPESPQHWKESATQAAYPASSSDAVPSARRTQDANILKESSLAAVLKFLNENQEDSNAQRSGINAITALARDEAQLRPLCLAAAAAVVRAAETFPLDVFVQRAAVAAMSGMAYRREVATLIAQTVLPAITAAMALHPKDRRVQDVACEALARLVQAGRATVVKAAVQAALTREEESALQVCSQSLLRLRESGICQPGHVLDLLLPLTESQPSNFKLQRRASSLLQMLLRAGVVDVKAATRVAAPLLCCQWTHILARFACAGHEEALEEGRFHAGIQALFHQEVRKHFEYEATERTLHLLRYGAPPAQRVQEVLRCLVENLEDYESRVRAREFAWDADKQRLVRLDTALHCRLRDEAMQSMELGLPAALKAAAIHDAPAGEKMLTERAATFRLDCSALLARKTELTQEHQERMEQLRREVMLFEAVEYLELHAKDVSATQVRTALYMLDSAEGVAPPEAVERLRSRLACLSDCTSLGH